jgi:hypothetical protein
VNRFNHPATQQSFKEAPQSTMFHAPSRINDDSKFSGGRWQRESLNPTNQQRLGLRKRHLVHPSGSRMLCNKRQPEE